MGGLLGVVEDPAGRGLGRIEGLGCLGFGVRSGQYKRAKPPMKHHH